MLNVAVVGIMNHHAKLWRRVKYIIYPGSSSRILGAPHDAQRFVIQDDRDAFFLVTFSSFYG